MKRKPQIEKDKSRQIFPLLSALCIMGSVLLCSWTLSGEITGSAEEKDGILLPVLMYHSILPNPPQPNKYIVSPELLESDLKYIKEKGYKTVLVRDLIEYIDNGTPLPEKPILLTFDDGFYNNYYYCEPLFKKYDMKGVISIVGSYTDRFSGEDGDPGVPEYSYLSWDDLRQLLITGRFEIQNHSYDMHGYGSRRGLLKKDGETPTQYFTAIKTDIGSFQNQIQEELGFRPPAMTYPFGLYSPDTIYAVKALGFRVSFTCEEGANYLPAGPEKEKDADCLYNMKRFLRPPGIPSREFFIQRGL